MDVTLKDRWRSTTSIIALEPVKFWLIQDLPIMSCKILYSRFQSFTTAPWASVFIHWLIGMVYVFYFASFVILLREVLRPGVLWFLRNLNDPDFNPIQEMIHLSIPRHMRRWRKRRETDLISKSEIKKQK